MAQASRLEQWLTPANVCQYIAQWTTVKARWGLKVDTAEKAALIRDTNACAAKQLTITKA